MKKFLINLLGVIVLLLLFFLSYSYYQNKIIEEKNKIKIGTTIGAIASILREIGADKIEIIDLSENAPHAHEIVISPQKLQQIKEAKIIFAIGANLDDFIDKISSELNIMVYKFDKDVELIKYNKKIVNSHYWLSLKNSKIIATKIATKLIELDSKNKDFYIFNLHKFYKEIDGLRKYTTKFSQLKNNKILVTHPGFDYLAKELNLEIIGYLKTEEGEGIAPRDLLNLAIKIKENNIKTIFVEKGMIDTTVLQFAKIYNLKIIELDPLETALSEQVFTKTLKENIEKLYNNLL
ncbi:MAG: metal ABC transporter substrate-binding protein [Candidatus Methanomethyliaceae archaeon]